MRTLENSKTGPRASNAADRARRVIVPLLLALAVNVAFVPAARAGGGADEAELHFQLATEHYQKGEFLKALEHFFVSNRLVPNRNVVFNIARTYEQLRRYADAHRYYTDALAEEDRPQTIQSIQAALKRVAPFVAILKVETTPPGATIFIDRKDLGSRGQAPRALAVPEGKYRVVAELEGYEGVTSGPVEAKVGSETVVPLKLTRIVGFVEVAVVGTPGAAVHVGDETSPPVCTAPCRLELPPGRHLLYFSRDGFQTAPRQVNVVAREVVRTTATLAALTGSLAVSADEGSAVIEIDGRLSGSTPATAGTPTVIPNVKAGTRRVRITLRGYVPIEREVVVKTGQQSELYDLKLLPQRTVSAVSRYAEQIEDAPSSVSVIDGQEIRAFGYPTIAEALRGTRGISVSNDHAYFSIGIRGLGQPNDYGNRLLVLSDGAALNDNILSSSYVGSDGRVDLGDVDRIEVVRGPGSLLYGTGAVSGLVNLVPRPREEPNSVHASFGTYDNSVMRARVGAHYNFTPHIGAWISAGGARSDGVDIPIELLGSNRTRTVSDVDRFRSFGTAGRFWAKDLTVQWLYHRRDQRIPVGVYGTVVGNERTGYIDERFLAEARYEPRLSEQFQVLVRAHANRYAFKGTYAYDDVPDYATAVENYTGLWFGGETRLVYTPTRALRLTAGGEAQAAATADIFGTYPNAAASDPDKTYIDTHTPYGFGAGYFLAEGDVSKWLRISGGVRVDGYPDFGAVFVPRGAVIVKPVTGGTLKVMGGRAFRVPSIYERFYTDGGETQIAGESGNHELEPESIVSAEVEYSQRFAREFVALAAVHGSRVDDFIETAAVPSQPGILRYQNERNPVLLAGVDVELRREWRQGWMASVMYGFQRAQRFNFGDAGLPAIRGQARLSNTPEHLGSFKGVVPVLPELLSLAVRTTLESPRLDEFGDPTPFYVVADLAVSGTLSRYGLSYVIGGYNLVGDRYVYPVSRSYSSARMVQNGRTFLAELKLQYPQ